MRFNVLEGPPTVVTDVTVAYDSTLLLAEEGAPAHAAQGRPAARPVRDRLDARELPERAVGARLRATRWWTRRRSSIRCAHTAQVQFRLVPNHLTHVGEIVDHGADEISPTTVLNSLTFRTGDLFRRSTMLESQRNLYESNLFRLAAIEVPQTFDSVKTVNVVLREAQLHEARLGGGFNTVDYLQTEGRFTALQPARRRAPARPDGDGRQPLRESAQRLGHLPQQTADYDASPATRTTSSSRRGRRASSSRSRRSCSGRRTRWRSARSRSGARCRPW